MSPLPIPATRSDLLSLLTEACELEHGLACSYLYAAFSLKREPIEGGVTIEQLHKIRYWASQIFFVASQEMLHLAQAWNLISAIGGTPYCLRPNLPQNSRYYPLHARIALEPFGERTVKRFIVYETPAKPATAWVAHQAELSRHERDRGHATIGELYEAIAEGFRSIGGLFTRDAGNQVDRKSVAFPDLTKVFDTATALRAITQITDQGEGTQIDRVDCHYGIFLNVLREFGEARKKGGRDFRPVRAIMDNPVATITSGYGANAHPIKDPLTRSAALLFDDVYLLMLQALAFGFLPSSGGAACERACAAAIELMTTVVRPLADALTTLPAGVDDLCGGPGFGLTRFIALASDPKIALAAVHERLLQLMGRAQVLATELPASQGFPLAASRLAGIAERLLC